jgi:hypothetical protein
MLEDITFNDMAQYGFACMVTLYLLWERTKFNGTIVTALEKISTTQERIVSELERLR